MLPWLCPELADVVLIPLLPVTSRTAHRGSSANQNTVWRSDPHDIIDSTKWPGCRVLDEQLLTRCDVDEWLLVVVWDESQTPRPRLDAEGIAGELPKGVVTTDLRRCRVL